MAWRKVNPAGESQARRVSGKEGEQVNTLDGVKLAARGDYVVRSRASKDQPWTTTVVDAEGFKTAYRTAPARKKAAKKPAKKAAKKR